MLINFVDVDITAVTDLMSRLTGKNFIFGSEVSGKITITSTSKLTPDEAFDLFISVLRLRGYSVVPAGKSFKIIPSSEAKQAPFEVLDSSKASFDLTKFDDFDEKSPAWLVYSIELNSLLVFYPESTTSTVHCISLANGSVCSWDIFDGGNNYPLKSITAVESSSNISTYLSYNPETSGGTYDEVCSVSILNTGDYISGVDNFLKSASGGTNYWYAELETGNLYSDEHPEGIKFALKHIIVHTYTDSTSVTYNPDIIMEVKSIEDSSWSSSSDSNLSSALTISGTAAEIDSSTPPSAFSNILGTANGYGNNL